MYDFILDRILDIYKKSRLISFPIDCFDLLALLGICSKPYTELPIKKRDQCYRISEDAFTLKGVIFYNDLVLEQRMRFTLMHELGHIILGHTDQRFETQEQEANLFASNILAPRIVIHYSGCKNTADVAMKFHLSYAAADVAFDDYRRWRRIYTYHTSMTDYQMYSFFNKDGKFIYHKDNCHLCFKVPVYNDACYCAACQCRLDRQQVIYQQMEECYIPDPMILSYLGRSRKTLSNLT